MGFNQRKNHRWLAGLMLVFLSWICLGSPGWCQTYVSGKVATADGMVVASGAVALEKGELHNNAFRAGGAVAPDGTFKIPLPSGGPWGLHVYSEKYIYFPLQIQVKEGLDNPVPVILPVDATTADDPQISDIQFNKISDHVIQLTMQVADPNQNLGPQMLAIDTQGFKAYRLLPRDGDLKDFKASFPQGQYVSPFIPLPQDTTDPKDWLFVVADHQCSNGPVLNGLGQSVFQPPVASKESLACEVPGIWKSNFDKLYQFSMQAPGSFRGEQFEGDLTIDQMVQKDRLVLVDYHYQGQKGTASLELLCQEPQVALQGTFSLPGRSGQWHFTKIQNAKADAARQGETLFAANCAICHFADSQATKVGPGLAGLSKRDKLPATGLPVNPENLRLRIINGGEKMPPFKHLKDDQIQALVDYLQNL